MLSAADAAAAVGGRGPRQGDGDHRRQDGGARARAATITWPLPQNQQGPTVSRIDGSLVLAVTEQGPFALTTTMTTATAKPGGTITVPLKLARHWADFKAPVQVTLLGLPGNQQQQQPLVTIAADKTEANVVVNVKPNMPPGVYTVVFRGQPQFPVRQGGVEAEAERDGGAAVAAADADRGEEVGRAPLAASRSRGEFVIGARRSIRKRRPHHRTEIPHVPAPSPAGPGAPGPPRRGVRGRDGEVPKEAQKLFRLPAGLRIELVASEPQIESPVAMAFDEDGKLWVVEMRDYPNGPSPGEKPQGRIKSSKTRTATASTRRPPSSPTTCCSPTACCLEGRRDRHGGAEHRLPRTPRDGKADTEVLYEGFAAQNPQLRVSHPILGLDGWIYVANGLRGGKVEAGRRRGRQADRPQRHGLPLRPARPRARGITGLGQYGNTSTTGATASSATTAITCATSSCQNRYLKRNPYLAAPAVVRGHLRSLEDGPLSSGGKVYPLSKNWTTSSLHAGRFTAACGVHRSTRGDLLPEASTAAAAFTCEPTGNLVHQEVLTPDGATFRSKPAQGGRRVPGVPRRLVPAGVPDDGPDGALYVVDMYRAVIEHPDFMPPELKNRPDLLLGKDKGRIWRIVPEEHKTQASSAAPGQGDDRRAASTRPGCGKRLAADDGAPACCWKRQDPARRRAVADDMAADRKLSRDSTPPGCWHALHGIDDAVILGAARSARATSRTALTLAERKIAKSLGIQKRLAERVDDFLKPASRVRFRLALTLGEWDDDASRLR